MKIFILRHAIAEEGRPNLDDRERRLTARGREELNEVVAGLRRMRVRPDEILASPYRRAWDTALVAARGMEPARRPIECPALVPSSSPTRIWLELKKHAQLKSLMLVGHEPLLSEFAAFLLNAPHMSIHLKKSGFIRIDLATPKVTRPAGVLRWLLTASQISRMA